MKILYLVNSLSAGGAEAFTCQLAIAMARRRHTVALYAYAGILDPKGEELLRSLREHGVSFFSPEARSFLQKSFVPLQLRKLCATFRPDITHSNLEQSDLAAYLASVWPTRRQSPRHVRTIHNVYAPRRIPPFMHRALARFFDITVACSDTVAASYPFLHPKRSVTIFNGVNIREPRQSEAHYIRKKYGISDNDILFVNIGSFGKRNGTLQKAQDIIVEALAKAKSPRLHVLFVGDGDHRMHIEELAKDKGVYANVHFGGLVADVAPILSSADVFLMPSRFEGMPIACMEAAILGKPLLLSRIRALEPFFGPSALLCEPDDPLSLADSMINTTINIEYLKSKALELQVIYKEKFNIDCTANKYFTLYTHLLLNKQRRT
ncbi:MAG: glycosyltransferase [Acetomicrobium sp.]|nr:glycosyltransferase [Acetomicrobium sp.]